VFLLDMWQGLEHFVRQVCPLSLICRLYNFVGVCMCVVCVLYVSVCVCVCVCVRYIYIGGCVFFVRQEGVCFC
jgi:hypothetical protein